MQLHSPHATSQSGRSSSSSLAVAFSLAVIVVSLATQTFGQCGYLKYGQRQPLDLSAIDNSTSAGFDVRSGDVDGDGHLDVVQSYVRSNGSSQAAFLRGLGNGTFAAPVVSNVGLTNYPFLVDVDGDGKLDLVESGLQPPTVHLYLSGGTFGPGITTNALHLSILDAADIDNDGKGDIVVRDDTSSPTVIRVLYGKADGTFDVGASIGTFQVGAFVADFDGDGKIDIVSAVNGILYLYPNAGSRTFGPTKQTTLVGSLKAVLDANGDGRADLIAIQDNGHVVLYLSVARTDPFEKSTFNFITSSGFGTLVGDFNGDNKADVMFHDTPRTVLFGDGAGGFSVGSYLTGPPGRLAGDFDEDGKTEVVNFVDSVFAPHVYDMALLGKTQCDPEPEPGFEAAGGFTVWRGSTGVWRRLYEIPFATFGSAAAQDRPMEKDFDGDGIKDAAVFRMSTGDWTIRRSSDSAMYTVHFGAQGDIPVPADYDGDGKADIAVFRQAQGDWYILQSSDGGFRALHWGLNGDKPVPADYDGDGKSDVCVYRPSNGGWYWLRSTDGVLGAVGFGIAEDIPLPADFDSDGKADLAVFRPSAGYWFILRIRDYHFQVIPWGQNADIPFVFYDNYPYYPRPTVGVFRPSQRTYWLFRDSYQAISFPGPADEVPVGSFYYD